MAKGGIYKAEVLRARDKLLAEGRYPSIDAVRIELGNTGSKGTIHRYLKEIEEEEGGPTGTKVAVSDAIQDLVGRLASRLHEEAETRIAEAGEKHRAEARQQADALAAVHKEADAFRTNLERTQLALAEERSKHEQTAARLQTETLERAQLAQQVADLQERLVAEEQHRQSLEEKHTHAREALEHFRQAVKEQREQDQRQHEQQIQYLQGEIRQANEAVAVKQHEAIQLNHETARLTTERARVEAELHAVQAELRKLKGMAEKVAAAERDADDLRRTVVEHQARIETLVAGEEAATAEVKSLADRLQQAELELAASKAAQSTHEQLATSIKGYLAELANRGSDSKQATRPRSGH